MEDKNMKKHLSLLLACAMLLSLLAGCAGSTPPSGQSTSSSSSSKSSASSEQDSTSVTPSVQWPTAPLQVIASGSAGGSIDTGARMLAQYLEQNIDQTIVINADKSIPQINAAREASNDGNTVLFTMGHFLIYSALDAIDFGLEDMQPCAIISEDVTFGLWVNANTPYETLDDLVAAMQAQPGGLTVGMLTSSYIHLASLAMLDALDCEALLVDVGGDADRVTALMGNQVDACIVPYAAAKPYAESGDLRCLAILSADAKTFADLGYDFDFPTNHSALYFPKGTDMAIVERANEIVRQTLQIPEYQEKLAANGCKPGTLDVEETTKFLQQADQVFTSIADEIK